MCSLGLYEMETAVLGFVPDLFAQRKTSRGFSQTVFMFYCGVEQRTRVDKITVYTWPTLLRIKNISSRSPRRGPPFTPGLNKPSRHKHVDTPRRLPSLPPPPPPFHTASRDSELFVQGAGEGGSAGSVCLARVATSATLRIFFFPAAFLKKKNGAMVFRVFNCNEKSEITINGNGFLKW